MQIRHIKDIKLVSGLMHDSEFTNQDFGFNPKQNKFYLESRSPSVSGEKFHLELYNVEKYNPINLEKIVAGKATGGVFNYIKTRNKGRKLTLISQDLQIKLELSELDGWFEKKSDSSE